MIELITELEVVRAPPAAFEERQVLIQLVMLVGIEQRVTLEVRRGGKAAALRKAGGQGIAVVVHCARSVAAPGKIRRRGRPSEVMIVLEKVAVAGGGDRVRGQGDVGAGVVGRIRSRPAEAVGIER